MADQEEERKIPLFTVLKKGSILKNIFLINNPHSISLETEETLIVGRHPDCNIVLTHPSISRFHLEIRSISSLHMLSVTDLSSVHGTWVSNNKIEPGVRVELKEGDALRIGGSTRIYRLHWIPFTRAYDMDNPFISPVDLHMWREQDQDTQMLEADIDPATSEVMEEGKPVVDDIEDPTQNIILDGLGLLFSSENSEWIDEKEITSESMKPMTDSLCAREGAEGGSSMALMVKEITVVERRAGMEKHNHLQEDFQVVPEFTNIAFEEENMESYTSKQRDGGPLVNLDGSLLTGELVDKETNNQNPSSGLGHAEDIGTQVVTKSMTSFPLEGTLSGIKKSVTTLEKAYSAVKKAEQVMKEANEHSLSERHTQSEPRNFVEEEFIKSSEMDDVLCAVFDERNRAPESLAVVDIQLENTFQTSLSKSAKSLSIHNTWSDRDESEFDLQIRKYSNEKKIQTGVSENEDETPNREVLNDIFILNPVLKNLEPEVRAQAMEDFTPIVRLKQSQKIGESNGNTSVSNATHRPSPLKVPFSFDLKLDEKLLAALENLEPEIFTPDKENLTPNSHALKRLKDMGRLEKSRSSSSAARRPFSSKENHSAGSDVQNQNLGVLQEKKPAIGVSRSHVKFNQETAVALQRKSERVPFKTLLENSQVRSRPSAGAPSAAARSSSSLNPSQNNKNRVGLLSSAAGTSNLKWTIVVDTTSLLDKNSRKSLQLLQGLKGTKMVIPRLVLRELDLLKCHSSLLRRTTEVSTVLEWVEECMINTKWWIDVQSSDEEAGQVAPTPPASPQSVFNGEAKCSIGYPFSSYKNSVGIVSPTSVDQILDCAMLYKRRHSDGQLVLISNDVNLKIKAMAEGLICETASEFYGTLVNPFSERFMWATSWPRGQTWSHLDDIVLRERYNNKSFKSNKEWKGENAKGLKLILLHNSQYGVESKFQIPSFS